ncbi:sortase [Streptomyces sp. NPDC006267]|uniref:sortase domain-containing protein n=1 Tax=Streptomyces sp. NPDC006267 TaxID=3157173 RepID=UPI0033B9E206
MCRGSLRAGRAGNGGSAARAGAVPRPGPRWGQAYAVLRVPRIGLTAPVAEGTGKGGVLDRGYVGHYARTAQAGQAGNFALAGHRNTHGEPSRRIDRRRSGDRITVETRDAVYTYTASTNASRGPLLRTAASSPPYRAATSRPPWAAARPATT